MPPSHRRDVTETSEEEETPTARTVRLIREDAERKTVMEAARVLCFWCKEGNPLGKDEQHHFGPGRSLQSCGALAIYRRWPAYAPGEKD